MGIQVGDEYIVEQVSTCCVRERERIVRCRDCVYRASDSVGEYCTLFDFEDVDSERQLNGFCAWGERKAVE